MVNLPMQILLSLNELISVMRSAATKMTKFVSNKSSGQTPGKVAMVIKYKYDSSQNVPQI